MHALVLSPRICRRVSNNLFLSFPYTGNVRLICTHVRHHRVNFYQYSIKPIAQVALA